MSQERSPSGEAVIASATLPDPNRFILVWLGFAAAYFLAEFLARDLTRTQGLALVRPGTGLLVAALWFSRPKRWGAWLAAQITIDLLLASVYEARLNPSVWLLLALGPAVGASTSAIIGRRAVAAPALPRIRQVLAGFGAVAVGAVASSAAAAFCVQETGSHSTFLANWQSAWAADVLGCFAVIPVILTWAVRLQTPDLSVVNTRRSEAWIVTAALIAVTAWVFSAPGGDAAFFRQPYLLIVLLVVCAFRLPPRWSTLGAAVSALLAAYLTAHGTSLFATSGDALGSTVNAQCFLATAVAFTFMLSTVLLQMKRTVDRLTLSEGRYRAFVAHSSEAVWRVELREPLPLSLSVDQQIEWLKKHAYIAECNLAYRALGGEEGGLSDDIRGMRHEVPWFAIYLGHLRQAAKQTYSMEQLRFSLKSATGDRVLWASFAGVIEKQHLLRIWGVAADVTSLINTTERLRREQDRLRRYALELTSAEERARRAVAVDLHDGVGQMLSGLAMNLDLMIAGKATDADALLRESRSLTQQIEASTRGLIVDLSPPGLYDFGLAAALNWLAAQYQSSGKMRVTLEHPELDLDSDTNVFLFRIIRECLQNVAKHAPGSHVRVSLVTQGSRLALRVSDDGEGARSEMNSGGPAFGLWSIRERVHAVGGAMVVKSPPGGGFHVRVLIPRSVASAPLIHRTGA
jgi:signal transduction histidine kinase